MKYRKKPIVIEAFRLGIDPQPDWFLSARKQHRVMMFAIAGSPDYAAIDTLEGEMRANFGDWIIQGVKNELYPCKHEIFLETCEPVEDAA